ncbi:MAG: DUF1573 domain-containing protein [Pseudomonadales bacterium]|nr:DUF1573 domain-containing protein [Pseudomonadales bacterium]
MVKYMIGRFFGILGLTLAIGACGSGSGSGSSNSAPAASPAQQPELENLAPISFSESIDQGNTLERVIAFENSGSAPLTYSVATGASWISILTAPSGTLAEGQTGQISFRLDCSAGTQNSQITLSTNDADEGVTLIPVDLVCNPPIAHAIARLTVNQASRAYDSDTSSTMNIPGLAGRDLLARVFVTGTGAVPSGDLVVTTQAAAVRFPLVVPPSVSQTPASESLLSASHYVVVPGVGIQQGAEIHAEIGGVRYPPSGTISLEVADPGVLGITLVPVTHNGQTPAIDASVYLEQTLQQLPIGDYQVQIRAPYTFLGAYDLDDLLDDIADLRTLDGSSDLYHAVIVPPNQSGSQTAGLAYVGAPVVVSIDLSGSQNIISHEIGHNFNLTHAPACAAPNTDPDFPQADGSVVNWGYDIVNRTLVEPTATKKDLMSYCNDVWISNYSFAKALLFRAGISPSGMSSGGQLEKSLTTTTIRGRLTFAGVRDLSVLPGGTSENTPSLGPVFRFQAWSRSGRKLVDADASVIEVEHGRPGERVFSLVVDALAEPIYSYVVSSASGVVASGSFAAQSNQVAGQIEREGAELSWRPEPGYVLVMRDREGKVVSLTRQARSLVPEGVVAVELMGPAGSADLFEGESTLHLSH